MEKTKKSRACRLQLIWAKGMNLSTVEIQSVNELNPNWKTHIVKPFISESGEHFQITSISSVHGTPTHKHIDRWLDIRIHAHVKIMKRWSRRFWIYIPQPVESDRSSNITSVLPCLTFQRTFWLNEADQSHLQDNRESSKKHQKSIRNKQWHKQKTFRDHSHIPILTFPGKQTWFFLKPCRRIQLLGKQVSLCRCSLSDPWKHNYFITVLLRKHQNNLPPRQTQTKFWT